MAFVDSAAPAPVPELPPAANGAGGLEGASLAAPPVLKGPQRPQGGQPQHIETLLRWANPKQTINLVDEMLEWDDGEAFLGALGMTCIRQLEIDERSRTDWETRTQSAMDLAMQVAKGKSDPWPDASNVIYPLVSVAAIQFQSRAYPQVIDGPKVVKAAVQGNDKGRPLLDPATGKQAVNPQDNQPMWEERPGGKQARAERIGGHMSWQLLKEQPEWEPETDQLLIILPIVGCIFRKTFRDHEERRNASALVLAQDLVINYKARSLGSAPRVTELLDLYPVEIEERVRSGVFIKHDIGMDGSAEGDEDAPREYIEQHRRMDLDRDGYPEPYVVTINRFTQKIVRVSPRFDPEGVLAGGLEKTIKKIIPVEHYTQYNFLPNPDGGIYGVGLGQLLEPINHAVNSTLNQLFDSGTVATMGGGFLGKGLGLKAGVQTLRPGEYKMVNAVGASVRDSVVPLQFPGPSTVMFQLLGFLVEAAKELGSNTEVLSGNQRSSNIPATTTLALIEQGLKVFSAVFKRIYRSLGKEFQKQARLNRIYLDAQMEFPVGDDFQVINQRDYMLAGASVVPIADPAMVSDMQQLVRAEALKEYLNHPNVNTEEVLRTIFTAMKLENVDKLIMPKAPDPSVQIKSIELALQATKIRATALKEMALGVKALAEADFKVNEQFGMWVKTNMEALQARMEAIGQLEGGDDGATVGPAAVPAPA